MTDDANANAPACRCDGTVLLWDEGAKQYAEHLVERETRDEGWSIVYVCPATEWLWLQDHPMSEGHGGGPLRLCRLWKLPPGAGGS